jgi:hypothetical protein
LALGTHIATKKRHRLIKSVLRTRGQAEDAAEKSFGRLDACPTKARKLLMCRGGAGVLSEAAL